MRHIQQVEVTYDDGTREQFSGRGVANVVNTHAPSDKDSPGREYSFLTLTLDLPLPTPPPAETLPTDE